MYRPYVVFSLIFLVTTFLPILCNNNSSEFVPTNQWQVVKEGATGTQKSMLKFENCKFAKDPILIRNSTIRSLHTIANRGVNVQSRSIEDRTILLVRQIGLELIGQSIPAGLHVRINLQTGEKQAKLMEKHSSSELATTSDESLAVEDSTSNGYLNSVKEKLQEALKNIPGEKFDQSDANIEEIKAKYRSYKQLKKEFKNVNMDIKTDTEIINSLIDEYKNTTNDAPRFLAILDDLDFLAHQIDNALWFIDRGGLDAIVLPAIVNGTDINARIKSLRLLGALIHNNPKAQIRALEKNCGNYLSHVLLKSTSSEETSAAVYAFGSLLRKFPLAQRENLSKTGTKALLNVLTKETADLRTKVKAFTLISDLLVEKEEVLKNINLATDDEGSQKKLGQYRNVLLDFWLHDEQFCDAIKSFVIDNHEEFGKEADTLEHLLQDMNTTLNLCFDIWSQCPKLQIAVTFLRDMFHNIHDDEFLIEISKLAELIYNRLYGNLRFNDEL